MTSNCTGTNEHNFFCTLYSSLHSFTLFTLLSIIVALLCFYYMALVADNYLSHCVSKLVQRIGLSQTLAGATLLAFANGSNDVISAYTAGGTEAGVPLIIGSIFGSGIVNFFVTSSIVLVTAEKIHLCKKSFVRDVGFFALGTSYVVVLGLYGKITLINVLGFYVIYLSYIGALILMEKRSKLEEAENYLEDHIFEENNPLANNSIVILDQDSPISSRELLNDDRLTIEKETDLSKEHKTPPNYAYTFPVDSISIENPPLEEERKYYILHEDSQHPDSTGPGRNCLRETAQSFESHQVHEKRLGVLIEQGMFYIGLPWIFLCNMTIPAVEQHKWDRKFAIVQVFGSVWLFLFANELHKGELAGFWIGYVIIPIQFCVAVAIWTKVDKERIHGHIILSALIGLLSAISWLELISTVVVEFVEFLGSSTGLNTTYLGMTLVALGYTVSDIISNRALARNGLEITGYTACFAGPLFNLLIGLSTSFLRQIIDFKEIKFHIFDFSIEAMRGGSLFIVGVIVITMLGLLVNLWIAWKKEFKLDNSDARIMLAIYIISMIVVTVYSIVLKLT